MWISNHLYVGTGPDPDTERASFSRDVVRVSTASQAHDVVERGDVAVVPTTDVARDTLVLLGSSPEWAWSATTPAGRAGASMEIE